MDLNPLEIMIDSWRTCANLKKTLLKFMHHILLERLTSHFINDVIIEYFDNIIYILKEDSVDLKLDVLEIYKSTLESSIIFIDEFPLYLSEKFDQILGLFETLIYDVYNSKLKLDDVNLKRIEDIFRITLDNKTHSCDKFKLRTCKYFVDKLCSDNSFNFKIPDEMQVKCSRFVLQDEMYLDNIFKRNGADQLLRKNLLVTLELIFRKIQRDLQEEISTSVWIIDNISPTWREVLNLIKNRLVKIDCGNNCVLEETLNLIDKVTEMMVKLKMEMDPSIRVNMEFFSEAEFILSLLSFTNMHISNCKSRYPQKLLIGILSKVPLLMNTNNIEIIFHIIGYPFLTLFYKSNNELPVNFSGRCDKKEARVQLTGTYQQLALLQESKDMALRNLCYFMCMLESGLSNTIDDINKHNLETNLMKIFSDVYSKGNTKLQIVVSMFKLILIQNNFFNFPACRISSDFSKLY